MLSEFRHSLRSLGRAPGLTAVSVVTIALGVGAGTALFSVVKAVLLNPLPYPAAERLAWVSSMNDQRHAHQTSLPDFDDWRSGNHSFTSLAGYEAAPVVVGGSDTPQRTFAGIVTEEFFDVMRVRPMLGRTFSAEEQQHGHAVNTVIIG